MPMVTAVLVAITLLAGGAIGPQQRQHDIDLQAAIRTESVDGDLQGAIKQYRAIVARYAQDRALVATALVRMAECHQKLGDAEARKIYDRVVRDFADQKEAVTIARARLGGRVVPTKGDRPIWIVPTGSVASRISPDGRFITHVDQSGRLLVRDLESNMDRALTVAVPAYAKYAGLTAISNDSTQVIYRWWEDDLGRVGLRIAALARDGLPEAREVFQFSGIRGDDWFDWSPDGRWIAAALRRRDGTGQIALIGVADRSFRVLKSTSDAHVPNRIFFSPNSRYIAYDLPASSGSNQRDVFVLAIDGNREIPAIVHSANEGVMGWSPDGGTLLFSSDRTGSSGLWGIRFLDGAITGPPELLKPDIGSSASLGLTASGTLFVHKQVSNRDIAVAPIDLNGRKLLGAPVSFTQGFVSGARASSWSRDGKYLAYPVGSCSSDCVAIRSVASGQVRLLPATLSTVGGLTWSPDDRFLLTRGSDAKGHDGIFLIDVKSGDVTTVLLSDGLTGAAYLSADGRKVFFIRRNVLFERQLSSGTEREITNDVWSGRRRLGPLSPDGQYFVARLGDASRQRTTALALLPVGGGEAPEFYQLAPGESIGPIAWLPDSSGILISKETPKGSELWSISIKGGEARKFEIAPAIWTQASQGPAGTIGFSLSPDGRSIAFQMGKNVAEVWALENFLPSRTVTK